MVCEIVDNGSFIYSSRDLDITDAIPNAQALTGMSGELEADRLVFKNFTIKEYEFINYISISEYRGSCRVCVSFSYSRYENQDNYKLAERQKTIDSVHGAVLRIFRSITGMALSLQELKVLSLDISNQLEVENIKNYYNVMNLIYRAYKQFDINGRLYFDTDDNQRLELDGLDFREQGKKRREANAYFKIYSKRKEIEDTKGTLKARGRRTALRGELTLKGAMLEKYGLNLVGSIQKKPLERVLKVVLGQTIVEGINKELVFNKDKLIKEYQEAGTKKIQEVTLINSAYIFDIAILDNVLTCEVLGIGKRTVNYHKKNIKEMLKSLETKGEIKRTFTGNFDRLIKLLKKITKVNIKEKGGLIVWED